MDEATVALLARIGVTIADDGRIIIGACMLDNYVHHSSVPVAVAALALAPAPSILQRRWGRVRLVDLVAKRPGMDGVEARAFAAVCGVEVLDERVASPLAVMGWQPQPADFIAQLDRVIYRYGLDHLFGHDRVHPACNGIAIRPFGFDWRTGEVDEAAVAAWRRAYRALPLYRQLLAATVLWLYRGGPDKTWLQRVPSQWTAADAIAALQRADQTAALRDWAKLVALYPGW